MMQLINQEQDHLWESVRILSQIDTEKAQAVFKATVEKSLQQVDVRLPVFVSFPLSILNEEHLCQLREIEKKMRSAYADGKTEVAYEHLGEYIQQLSQMAEDPSGFQKKLLASLLNSRDTAAKADVDYYTPNEAAKKIGLSDQTIRRMCENKKFPRAYKTQGGHWRIPQDYFVTTSEQDETAESLLERIDHKNREVGDVDEFDL
ncbi:helix-turn-helix domain-containing protein [Salicibibacter cibi]|uniref:Helix-turn-helix domain-containing protein n=1 Tax=Salicibibacter cibi TaxID=2743001 RepID=A0A7T6ZBL8_9BACI|nr:helix-turn-helix domain-containing protein [Salicibibacter cibi]QQK80458.1 helix-turn-helix domain-containing protein [Salicibibacter cibi]